LLSDASRAGEIWIALRRSAFRDGRRHLLVAGAPAGSSFTFVRVTGDARDLFRHLTGSSRLGSSRIGWPGTRTSRITSTSNWPSTGENMLYGTCCALHATVQPSRSWQPVGCRCYWARPWSRAAWVVAIFPSGRHVFVRPACHHYFADKQRSSTAKGSTASPNSAVNAFCRRRPQHLRFDKVVDHE